MKKNDTIAVVGLGYVGLPLAILASRKGYRVIALDIDAKKIKSLKIGRSYVDDVTDEELKNNPATFSNDFALVEQAQAIFVCVPTPVSEDKMPDLAPVRGAIKCVAPHLKDGALVVLESTVNPGVSNDIVVPLLEEHSGKRVDQDIYLAHCPERINPGDPVFNVSNISRVIGADNKKALEISKNLYESLIDAEIKPMSSLKEAEAVKVVENSFRNINIAFVNELAMSFDKMGIDVVNVINGAATKPFSFMPHYPSCGIGGHCIPVDPFYLVEYARGFGFDHDFLRLALATNQRMPIYTVELLEDSLNELKRPLNGTSVALLGLAYKANIGDDRESPAYEIKEALTDKGANVITFDPYLPDKSDVKSFDAAIKDASAIILATGHKEFTDSLTPKALKDSGVQVIVDGQNKLRESKTLFEDAGIIYKGIGT